MKKLSLIASGALAAVTAMAQGSSDYAEPYVWEEVVVQVTSANGAFVGAQDDFMNCYSYETATGTILTYEAAVAGDSQFIANDGTMVGEDVSTSFPAVMRDGKVTVPAAVGKYYGGAFESITPDARYATGYVGNAGYPLYLPVVYDLVEQKLEVLPYPERDLFGYRAQGYVPHVISDDGTTVAGLVIDGTGMFSYPIIYKKGADGVWTYSLPTEKFFNTDGFPVPDEPGDDDEPDWGMLEYLGRLQHFGGTMAISPDGRTMVTDGLVMPEEGTSTVAAGYVPWSFDTVDGSCGPLPTTVSNLLPTQVLADGTVLAVTSPSEFLPFMAYVLLPGADDFILFTDWLLDTIPAYYPWIEDTLGMYGVIGYEGDEPIYGDYIITGKVCVSADLTVVAGGLQAAPFLSYIFYDPERASGIEAVEMPQTMEAEGDGIWYNLQGMPVENPGKGIFIRNGRKILVR